MKGSSKQAVNGLPGSSVNQLSEGTHVKGVIRSKSDIRIDGVFEGDLMCESKVVIGKNGKFHGKIFCMSADIQGKVEGELKATTVTTLRTSAYLNGNITTEKLMIENGARFNGNCNMVNQGDQKQAVATDQKQAEPAQKS